MSFFNKKNKSNKQLTNEEWLAKLTEEVFAQQKQKELSDSLRANAISAIKEKADAYKKDRELALSKEDSLRLFMIPLFYM